MFFELDFALFRRVKDLIDLRLSKNSQVFQKICHGTINFFLQQISADFLIGNSLMQSSNFDKILNKSDSKMRAKLLDTFSETSGMCLYCFIPKNEKYDDFL